MRRKIMTVFCSLLIVMLIMGCGSKNGETQPTSDPGGSAQTAGTKGDKESNSNSEAAGPEESAMTGTDAYREAMEFMIREYGFTAEELLGVDVEAIVNDYRLKEMDYTREEVQEILDEQGDSYSLDPADDVFSILGMPDDIPVAGPDLAADADIIRIGYYVNNGSLQKKMMFDLEDGIYYFDDALPYNLTDEQVSALKDVPVKAGIASWQHKYEREDEPETTGSYRWKMVFQLRDGTQCVYGGYTRDMQNFPEGYSTADETFRKIAEGK